MSRPEPTPAVAEEIDQAARQAATALRTLGELARSDYRINPALHALEVLAADDGPLAELCAVFTDLASYLGDFEHEDAETAADAVEDAAGQLYGGPDAVNTLLHRAANTLRPLAD